MSEEDLNELPIKFIDQFKSAKEIEMIFLIHLKESEHDDFYIGKYQIVYLADLVSTIEDRLNGNYYKDKYKDINLNKLKQEIIDMKLSIGNV